MAERTIQFGVFGVVIDRAQTHLVVVRHNYGSGQWSLPGGGLELGELVTDGFRRELREETGWSVENLLQVGTFSQRKTPGVVMLFAGYTGDRELAFDQNEIAEVAMMTFTEALRLNLLPAQRGLIEAYRNWDRRGPIYGFMIPELVPAEKVEV